MYRPNLTEVITRSAVVPVSLACATFRPLYRWKCSQNAWTANAQPCALPDEAACTCFGRNQQPVMLGSAVQAMRTA